MNPIYTLALALFFTGAAIPAVSAADTSVLLPSGDRIYTESILFNGNFAEEMEGWNAGGYIGQRPETNLQWNNRWQVRRDGQNTFARLTCLDKEGADFAVSTAEDVPLPLGFGVTHLVLSYRFRIAQLQTGPENYMNLRFYFHWYNPDGERLSESVVEFRRNFPYWTDRENRIPVPKNATYFKFGLHFLATTGIIDVTDIKILPLAVQK